MDKERERRVAEFFLGLAAEYAVKNLMKSVIGGIEAIEGRVVSNAELGEHLSGSGHVLYWKCKPLKLVASDFQSGGKCNG